jgi:hypothetical protein
VRNAVYRLICEEQAQDLIEYALLCACLGVACITVILDLSGIVNFFTVDVGVVLKNSIS